MIRVTVLAENTAGGRGFIGEHGLALWIESAHHRFLFDTGQGIALIPNAHALGIELDTADGIILSHGHYDHTGGISYVVSSRQQARVYAHPNVYGDKYSIRPPAAAQYIGIPPEAVASIRQFADFIPVTEPMHLGDNIHLTGPIPRNNEYEDVGGPFYCDKSGLKPDTLLDDQALYHVNNDGIAIVLGCAHAGVINTVSYIRELVGERPIRALLGGMHLVAANTTRLQWTVSALRNFDIALLAPMHCTGPSATALIWNEFPDRVVALPTGKTIEV